MSKILLKQVQLINWYGFIQQRIPIGRDLTLITGENECGKSTILDAIKYAFSGDTQFNKSTSTRNAGEKRRDLISYTRCLVDPSAGIYARPVDKMPLVCTHIALEYEDELYDRTFVLGVVLETGASREDISHYWYVFEQPLDEIAFTHEENGRIRPYDHTDLQKKYGLQLMSKTEGIKQFMQRAGLNFRPNEVPSFQKKLRAIMAYNPSARIQEFIKESVLEQHDVKFEKLKEAKKNIEGIHATLDLIQSEVDELNQILQLFKEHDSQELLLNVDDAKKIYKQKQQLENALNEAADRIESGTRTLEDLKKAYRDKEQERIQADDAYSSACIQLEQLDCNKAVQEEKRHVEQLGKEVDELEEECTKLKNFCMAVQAMVEEVDLDEETKNQLLDLYGSALEAEEKEHIVLQLKKAVSLRYEEVFEESIELKRKLKEKDQEQLELDQRMEALRKHQIDLSDCRNEHALLKEIQAEFDRLHLSAQAHFACDFVHEIKDEDWRSAIERYLNRHRYAILVDPEVFLVAENVLDRSAYKHVELINTRLLAGKQPEIVEDSVLHLLDVEDEYARKWFAFWLGRIHAVSMDKVCNYELAMSKEGKLSRNMCVTYLDLSRLRSYCLGQKANELNLRQAEKRMEQLLEEESQLRSQKKQVDEKVQRLKEDEDCFVACCFDAPAKRNRCMEALNGAKAHLCELEDALKTNNEWMTLNEHVEVARKRRDETSRTLQRISEDMNRLKVQIEEKRHFMEEKRDEFARLVGLYESSRKNQPNVMERAVEEYDLFVRGDARGKDVYRSDRRAAVERKEQSCVGNLIGAQKAYNLHKENDARLMEGKDSQSFYVQRRNRIDIEDLAGVKRKLSEQTARYEQIFKNEFVLEIYQQATDGIDSIRRINRELRKLNFSTSYQFDVHLLDDKSDYARILRFAEVLKKTNNVGDGQMMFTDMFGFEDNEVEQRRKEIEGIINRIIEHNDDSELHHYADYRNYMSYEILVNNAEIKNGKLSKVSGYNSGAGTQIPYTLILSAALSMIYNNRENSVRLLFIDEPFEKMSDHNIKLMLQFFKDQDFQVIFCAPPNKTDSIGSECDTVIPLIKVTNSNMQMGSVQFHEQQRI